MDATLIPDSKLPSPNIEQFVIQHNKLIVTYTHTWYGYTDVVLVLPTLECCSKNLATCIALEECLSILTGRVFRLLCSKDASDGDYSRVTGHTQLHYINYYHLPNWILAVWSICELSSSALHWQMKHNQRRYPSDHP